MRVYAATERECRTQYESIQQDDKYQGYKLPRYPRLFRLYDVASTIILGWVFLKYLVPSPFAQVGKLFYSTFVSDYPIMASHCYVFGRFVIHHTVPEESFGCLVAFLHLTWRLAQRMLDKPRLLNVLLFLLQPEVDIRCFLDKLNSSGACEQKITPLSGKLTAPGSTSSRPYGANRLTHLTDRDLFLCHILCHKITYPGLILYKLRPNRTLEARRKLAQWLSSTTLMATLTFGLLAVIIGAYFASAVLFNQYRYLSAYPDCDLQLTVLFRQGNLTAWSTRLSSHKLATLTFDVFETSILLIDSGLALMYLQLFDIYLNWDLLLYWTHLDKKIRRLLVHSTQMHHQICEGNSMMVSVSSLHQEYNLEIYQLQAELAEFFRQINEVDLLVSDVISHSLLVWLSAFGWGSFRAVQLYATNANGGGLNAMIALMFVFLTYSVASMSILSLQRRCRSSYASLCSLIAYDQSNHKRQFMEIINFYTTKNRTCYTLFHQYPFSTAIFVSVLGWSVTGYLIIDNFSSHHRHSAGGF